MDLSRTTMSVESKLSDQFGRGVLSFSLFRDNRRIVAPSGKIHEVLEFLKNACGFDFLADICGVDYLEYPNARDRYGVIYALLGTESGERLYIKTFVNDPDPSLKSVCDLWRGANWMEREIYDMFGVRFEGHPDLRRILMPEEFEGHPLRKDYPLRGRGERHNFPVITRAES